MDGIQLESDYAPAFNAWKAAPSPTTSSALLGAVRPVIDTTLRQYSGGSPSPSLKSKAKILALNAFKSYDPTKGRLRTHLYSHMQGLQRINARENNIITIPERVALDYGHVQEASASLRDRLGREPSNAELSNHTGLSAKRLAYIRQSNLPVSEGAATQIDAEGDQADPAVNIPGRNDGRAWEDFVYYDLGSTDQVIMDYVLGRHGMPKLQVNQIAAKLGVTPSAVSQRTMKIQKLLDMRNQVKVL